MLTNSRLVHQPHDHGRCINAAMTRAHDLCIEQNARMTTTRESVLRLLWQSHRPLGAYQLQDQLAELLNKPIAPPTVYRAIEFLLQLGLIHRLPSLNAYIGCPFPGNHHSDFFLICRECGSAAECSADPLNIAIEQTAKRAHFKVESQMIEIAGLCPECQPDNQQGCEQ